MTSGLALLRDARSSGVHVAAIDYLLLRGYTLARAHHACRPYGTPQLRTVQDYFASSGLWTCPADVDLVQSLGRPARALTLMPILIPVIPGALYTVTIGTAAAVPEVPGPSWIRDSHEARYERAVERIRRQRAARATRFAHGSTTIASWDATWEDPSITHDGDGLLILEYSSGILLKHTKEKS